MLHSILAVSESSPAVRQSLEAFQRADTTQFWVIAGSIALALILTASLAALGVTLKNRWYTVTGVLVGMVFVSLGFFVAYQSQTHAQERVEEAVAADIAAKYQTTVHDVQSTIVYESSVETTAVMEYAGEEHRVDMIYDASQQGMIPVEQHYVELLMTDSEEVQEDTNES